VAGNAGTPTPQAGPATQPKANPVTVKPVSHLADMTLPAFRLSNLRGESGNPAFVAGMNAYTKKDFAKAAALLAQVPAGDRDSLAARFFDGVCKMHTGDLDGAAHSLRGVSDAGDSPEQEAALYYQAQIALARNDAALAGKLLKRTIALHGDYERRAMNHQASLQSINENIKPD